MKRAFRKKMKKKFQVGDIVTWGEGVISHKVIEVQEFGVVVDATSAGWGHLFVRFDKHNRHKSGRGPVRHSNRTPDVLYKYGEVQSS